MTNACIKVNKINMKTAQNKKKGPQNERFSPNLSFLARFYPKCTEIHILNTPGHMNINPNLK